MDRRDRTVILAFGIVFLLMEIFKQAYLFFIVFDGHYDVWYFPFQLCSMAIYLCLIAGCFDKYSGCDSDYPMNFKYSKDEGIKINQRTSQQSNAITINVLTFLQDYGLLGGIMALIVRDGFTFDNHPILTIHGFLWHLLMIALALFIFVKGYSNLTTSGFVKSCVVYLICAAIAFAINVALHRFGDCDMFYISPYHLSSQPVFSEIDGIVGRPVGIAIYLASTMLGAGIVHFTLSRLNSAK